MNAYELEQALVSALGECTDNPYNEWWSEYTGPNGFYHLLAGTGWDVRIQPDFVKNGDTVTVPGLGDFTFVEIMNENLDTYEQSWDTVLVFEFGGKHYRVHGRLDSHQGGVYEGRLQEVVPVEKTITVWEKI